MKKKFIFLAFLIFSGHVFSQTFNGGGGVITDDGNYYDFTINASGLSAPINAFNFGLEQVCLNITHTYVEDMDISLIAPDGTVVPLTSGNGGSGDDYSNTCFRNDATTPVIQAAPPFSGTFKPEGDLSTINNGQNGNGPWKLHIRDTYPGADQGTLLSWSITFGSNPATSATGLSCTNLPIIVINTNSQTIIDEPKIICDMGIIYNGVSATNCISDPLNNYSGKIAIEVRGSSSQMFPKKTYGFETRNANGTKNDVQLLGMPVEHDWILSASYTDKTHLRNPLSYKLYNDFGRYAVRTRHCELVINGQYQGVYILMERIKRDPNRVDISKLKTTENAGDSLTGGYIIKIDKPTGNGGPGWTSPFPPAVNSSGQVITYQYEYPDPDSITSQQKNYIQQYVDSFETALAGANYADPLNGYAKYCKVNSFIDYFILNEISANVDGYRLSTYLYKDRFSSGGKLGIGPPWDYDIAWLNADYCGSPSYTNWAYKFGDICPGDGWQIPFWWDRFLQDPNFRDNLKCRWVWLRSTVLATSVIHSYIDSTANVLAPAMGRNFAQWPILGTYVWPNPQPIPQTYPAEIVRLKQWISDRLTWLDANMPGTCMAMEVNNEKGPQNDVSIFPNPTSGEITVYGLQSGSSVELYNAVGEKIASSLVTAKGVSSGEKIDLTHVSTGVYFVKVIPSAGDHLFIQKIIRVE